MHEAQFHARSLKPALSRSYGSDDGVFGLDDAFQVVAAGAVLFVLAGVALAIGPNPVSDPFGMNSRKRK
jgi:hypothetical protein